MAKAVILLAETPEEFQIGRALFQAYAQGLDFDLSFQDFQKELRNIEQTYTPPLGALLLVKWKEKFVGCVGIRTIEPTIGELKRMYLDISLRGRGMGEKLMIKAIEIAKQLGMKKLRLDTLPKMQSALNLYKKVGFEEIKAYRYNPFKEAIFLELTL